MIFSQKQTNLDIPGDKSLFKHTIDSAVFCFSNKFFLTGTFSSVFNWNKIVLNIYNKITKMKCTH